MTAYYLLVIAPPDEVSLNQSFVGPFENIHAAETYAREIVTGLRAFDCVPMTPDEVAANIVEHGPLPLVAPDWIPDGDTWEPTPDNRYHPSKSKVRHG